jgi:glucans biosynthesis protein C
LTRPVAGKPMGGDLSMNKHEHADYLDWLRVGVVALLIPHHAAITFSHLGDAYVYRSPPSASLYYFIQSVFLNLWFMRMLFFVSGISTCYALKKRTYEKYFVERVKRLIVPTVFAVMIVCPVSAYFKALNVYGFTGSFIAFYPEFFKGFVSRYLGWGHFWFLVYLFVYSVMLAAVLWAFPRHLAYAGKLSRFLSRKRNVFLPMLVIVAFEMLFRPFFPGLQNLYADWANFTVYLSFFIFGYVMAHTKESLQAISSHMLFFGAMSSLSTLLFIVMKYGKSNIPMFISYSRNTPYAYALALALLLGIAEYAWVMFFMGAGRKYFNRGGRLLSYLSKTSFALYMFHFVILSGIVYYLLKTSIPDFAIFIISVCLTYPIFFLMFELIIKRNAVLRYVCGIRDGS